MRPECWTCVPVLDYWTITRLHNYTNRLGHKHGLNVQHQNSLIRKIIDDDKFKIGQLQASCWGNFNQCLQELLKVQHRETGKNLDYVTNWREESGQVYSLLNDAHLPFSFSHLVSRKETGAEKCQTLPITNGRVVRRWAVSVMSQEVIW